MKKQVLSITVQGCGIAIHPAEHGNYLSLTDMAKSSGSENEGVVKNWLRNKNTLEFLGVWEEMYNPNFNLVEFDLIRSASGVNSFIISSKEWVERTQAIGIIAKTGRYQSGTFAHEEIAMEFATWLSPQFRLFVLKEFKRLKDLEADNTGVQWNLKRLLSRANYHVQTDAIKETLIPAMKLKPDDEWMAYTSEADLLNQVVFGMSAKEWRAQNPQVPRNENIRDHAGYISLAVLSNLESINATLIRDELPKRERFYKLSEIARQQFESLSRSVALREQANKAEKGLKALDAPQPPPSIKPPATGAELKPKFKEMKEMIERISRVPPPPKPDEKK